MECLLTYEEPLANPKGFFPMPLRERADVGDECLGQCKIQNCWCSQPLTRSFYRTENLPPIAPCPQLCAPSLGPRKKRARPIAKPQSYGLGGVEGALLAASRRKELSRPLKMKRLCSKSALSVPKTNSTVPSGQAT